MEALDKYRGQWGGRIETGEEMWWSEPSTRLATSRWARFLFALDVRQHFILKFWRAWRSESAQERPLVLDFGCGTGGTTLNFSRYWGVPVTGLDVFETQLKIARSFAEREGSECRFERIGEAGRLPVAEGAAQVVLSLDVLGHVPQIPPALAELARVLEPGGSMLLFTEATYSAGDRSLMAHLARRGADMAAVVPEHISLYPREELERMFATAGFEILERYSANVWHFLFFPKDYVMLLRGRPGFGGWFAAARVWNRLSKITPFYPWPFQALRLAVTYLFGRKAYGTSYFYHLRRIGRSH